MAAVQGKEEDANLANQQPEGEVPRGEEPPKSSEDDAMFLAYGDKYASRAAGDDAYGERYGPRAPDPFHKDVKGERAVELGVPELRNREEVRKKHDVHKVKEGDVKKTD